MNLTQERKATKIKLLSPRGLTVISLLSAIAIVLMMFEMPLWFAPNFYKLDLSEVPVLIGAFALGPVAGIMIEFIKILLNLVLKGTDTAFIGEIANFVLGCSLIIPSAIIYHRAKNIKSAFIGMAVGTIAFVIVGSLLNAYVLLPTYATIYGMPLDKLVAMGTAVNPKITDLNTFILFAVAPFNLIKGIMASVVTGMLYKGVSPIIKGYHRN